MKHAKLWHTIKPSILWWMFTLAIISGINTLSLVSTSPVTAEATANPIFQLNATGNLS